MEAARLITDRAVVEQIIRDYSPSIDEITYIDHGHDNLVVCVNQQFVFRFPRNNQAVRRLEFEVALLQFMRGKITALPIPQLVKVSGDPLYVVATYREGIHLNNMQIAALSADEQTAIGHKIAEFVVEFSHAVTVEEIMLLRKEAGLIGMEEPWPEYFERLFVKQPLPSEKLRPIVAEYYGIWKQYTAGERPVFAIHDDLHPANIIFAGSAISGVLDFGDANVGSIEEELRGVYRMGDEVLHAAIRRYQELTGRQVEYDHVRIWAIMNDLARFTRYMGEDRTKHPAFMRAHTNLKEWIPGFPF